MKRSVLTLVISITLYYGLSAQLLNLEEKPFETPEEAIEYFVEGLSQGDLMTMLEVCNIKRYGQNFNLTKFVDRLRAFNTFMFSGPSEYELYQEINVLEQLARVSKQIMMIYYSLFGTLPVDGTTTIIEDAALVTQFIGSVDPTQLNNLSIIQIVIPYEHLVRTERYQRNVREQADIMGGNSMTERIVLLRLDNRTIAGGFQLIQYDDGWLIQELHSALSGMAAMGGWQFVTLSEYAELVGNS